ncbi:MAG: hypothetical protein K6F63_10410 [Lachnospiraceae bacterium]|nr:hypothetical protein [Lachnospiraceae bacterium]
MPEQLKNIQKKVLEYWNKWTTKQKTVIIGSFAGVVLIIAFFVFFLGRTRYTELYKFQDTETASRAVTALKEAGYASKLGSDNNTVLVDEDHYVEAVTTVYSADIGDDSFNIDDLLDTSLTTTNGERLQRTFLRSESVIRDAIMCIQGITSVTINYIPKDTSNSVIAANQTIPAAVTITYNNKFNKKQVAGIASIVAKGLGNKNTDDITIVDQNGEVLFDGSEVDIEGLDLTDKVTMEKRIKSEYKECVTGALIMNGYTEVDVATYLNLNWDKVTQMFEEYLPLEGEDRGVLVEYHETSSSNQNTSGDVPGTDSNDETDYMLSTGESGNSETYTEDDFYKPSVRVTETAYNSGTISNASISVTARRVVKRTKTELEMLGELTDEMTYDRYILTHQDPVRTTTPEELVRVVSLATGIEEDDVILITYDVYQFIDDQAANIDVSMVVQIALAVLLLVILLIVILRGMRPVEITEVEPELSIEQLLATTKENQSLEDVEFSEESETRKMIEKFFDENPEAVAALLRNWLNEDWM